MEKLAHLMLLSREIFLCFFVDKNWQKVFWFITSLNARRGDFWYTKIKVGDSMKRKFLFLIFIMLLKNMVWIIVLLVRYVEGKEIMLVLTQKLESHFIGNIFKQTPGVASVYWASPHFTICKRIIILCPIWEIISWNFKKIML